MFEITAALPGQKGLKTAPDVAGAGADTGNGNPFQAILAQQAGAMPSLPGAVTIAVLPEGGKELPVAVAGFAGLPGSGVPVPPSSPALPGFPVSATAIGLVEISAAEAGAAAAGMLVETEITDTPADQGNDGATGQALVTDLSMLAALLSPPVRLGAVSHDGQAPAEQPIPGSTPAVNGAALLLPKAEAVLPKTPAPQPGQGATFDPALSAKAPPPHVLSAVIEREATDPATKGAKQGQPFPLAAATPGEPMGVAVKAASHALIAARVAERESAASAPGDSLGVNAGSPAGDALPALSMATAHAAPTSAVATPRVERIDFATLVDSIARARDEAAGDAVKVAVAHAEFGKVSLSFEPAGDGLSVAMASSDPGFARAVAAAGQADAGTMNADSQQSRHEAQPRATDARQGNGAGGENMTNARGGNGRRQDHEVSQQPRQGASGRQDMPGEARDGIFA